MGGDVVQAFVFLRDFTRILSAELVDSTFWVPLDDWPDIGSFDYLILIYHIYIYIHIVHIHIHIHTHTHKTRGELSGEEERALVAREKWKIKDGRLLLCCFH